MQLSEFFGAFVKNYLALNLWNYKLQWIVCRDDVVKLVEKIVRRKTIAACDTLQWKGWKNNTESKWWNYF